MRKTGIMGGTFDPIHIGHLLVARAALEQCGLDEVWFMTGGLPPHKRGKAVTPPEIRHAMVKLAIDGENGFKAVDYEVKKTTYSYTAETLMDLKALYPENEFYFIIGEDSLRDIGTWYKPKSILKNCILLVYPRLISEDIDVLIEKTQKSLGGDIRKITAPLFGISSTEIRQRAGEGKSVKYLVPDSVAEYIIENKLYGAR